MEAQFYKTKEQAIEAANNMIEFNKLKGVLRPSSIVQTITLNQIHETMIDGEDRRAYMVLWPNDEDLVSFYQEADDKAQEIRDRHDALRQKIAEMEAENSWLAVEDFKLGTARRAESADKVLVAEAPADNFQLKQSETGEFEVRANVPAQNDWN